MGKWGPHFKKKKLRHRSARDPQRDIVKASQREKYTLLDQSVGRTVKLIKNRKQADTQNQGGLEWGRGLPRLGELVKTRMGTDPEVQKLKNLKKNKPGLESLNKN